MAVKKAQTSNKADPAAHAQQGPGLVSVTVGAGPIHYDGRRWRPGEVLDMPKDVADALIAAKLVTAAKG